MFVKHFPAHPLNMTLEYYLVSASEHNWALGYMYVPDTDQVVHNRPPYNAVDADTDRMVRQEVQNYLLESETARQS